MVSLLIGTEEVDYDVDAEEYIYEIVDECCKGRVLVNEGNLERHNRRCVSQQKDDRYVPECFELAIGHDDVPSWLLLQANILIALLGHELPAEKLDLCCEGLLLVEHDSYTQGAVETGSPQAPGMGGPLLPRK